MVVPTTTTTTTRGGTNKPLLARMIPLVISFTVGYAVSSIRSVPISPDSLYRGEVHEKKQFGSRFVNNNNNNGGVGGGSRKGGNLRGSSSSSSWNNRGSGGTAGSTPTLLDLNTWPELWSSPPSSFIVPPLDPPPPPLIPGEVSATPLWETNKPTYEQTSYGGYTTHSVSQPYSKDILNDMLSPQALTRAREWSRVGKRTWCGTRDDPEGFVVELLPPLAGTTKIPYACPNSPLAKSYLEQGITQRYAFQDNESYCSLKKATIVDPSCSLAYLALTLPIGPNVNMNFIASSEVYAEIIDSLQKAEEAIMRESKQVGALRGDAGGVDGRKEVLRVSVKVSGALLEAFRRRFLPLSNPRDADRPDDADATKSAVVAPRVGMSEATYQQYNRDALYLTSDYVRSMTELHESHPEDELVSMLTVSALMQNPGWKWWHPGSDYPLLHWEDKEKVDDHDAGAGSILGVEREANPNEYDYPTILRIHTQIQSNNARANQILTKVLSQNPKNVGANHFLIHSLEGGPHPEWALSAANRLQHLDDTGHAQHMPTHIYSRLGQHGKSIEWNKRANYADFTWALDRAGGSVLSPFYPYESHNIGFIHESAMLSGHWGELCASLALHTRLLAFRVAANPEASGGRLALVLSRLYLYPLRFGRYEEILRDVGASPVSDDGQYEYGGGEFVYTEAGLRARLHAVTVSAARTGKLDLARVTLGKLLEHLSLAEKRSVDSNNEDVPFCHDKEVQCVKEACDFYVRRWRDDQRTSDPHSFVTNDDPVKCLQVLVPLSDLLVAESQYEKAQAHLQQAWLIQKTLQYDEPSPFYFPIVQSLGKVQLLLNKPRDAAASFREGLYTWPKSIHLSLGFYEALRRYDEDSAFVWKESLVEDAFKWNDTAIDLKWL